MSRRPLAPGAVPPAPQPSDGTSSAAILGLVGAELSGMSRSLGDLVNAEPGTGAAATATINAVDLLAGTVVIANGPSAISVPQLAVNLPLSGTGLTTSLSVIERPRMACGMRGTVADTAQVALSIGGTLGSLPSILGLTATGTSDIAVSVASARETLTDIICGSETASDPSGEDVQVTSGLVGASASVTVNLDGDVVGVVLPGLSALASIRLNGQLRLSVSSRDPSTVRTAEVRVPNSPADWGEPYPAGSGDLGLNTFPCTPSG